MHMQDKGCCISLFSAITGAQYPTQNHHDEINRYMKVHHLGGNTLLRVRAMILCAVAYACVLLANSSNARMCVVLLFRRAVWPCDCTVVPVIQFVVIISLRPCA